MESLFPEVSVRVVRGAINRVITDEDKSRFSKENENLVFFGTLRSWQTNHFCPPVTTGSLAGDLKVVSSRYIV